MQDEENWNEYILQYKKINKTEKSDIIFKWKVDNIFKYFKNDVLEEIDIVEADKFYKKLYYGIITEEEKNKNKLITMDIHVKNSKDNFKESVLYKIKGEKETLYYIYLDSEKSFRQISEEDLRKMNEEKRIIYDSNCNFNLLEKMQEEH